MLMVTRLIMVVTYHKEIPLVYLHDPSMKWSWSDVTNQIHYISTCRNGFALYFPIAIPCLLEYMVTYFNTYMKLQVSLKEHERVFFKRQNLIFSTVADSIWFVIDQNHLYCLK